MTIEMHNNTDAQRYELTVDGALASLVDYAERDGAWDFPHTETRDGFGGQGYAATLVRFALDDMAVAGQKIRPLCPFVAAFIVEHPEYQTLVADDAR